MPRKIGITKKKIAKKSAGSNEKFICFNKDCKLRKQKSCKGFEGCPGFQGK
jgi:hypothetical protein